MQNRVVHRTMVAAAVCATALVGVGANAAAAGEITGNGTFKDVKGKSICAYSGQNDGFHHVDHQDFDGDDARVQTYGQLVRQGLKGAVPGPGVACNPTRGFPE